MPRRRLPRAARGVTLIELLVGMVVALIGGLAIAGATYFFEQFKRSQFGANAAGDSGVTALLVMQRDVRSAGLGIAAKGRGSQSTVICPSLNAYYNGALVDNVTVAPVWIERSAVAGGSDTVTVSGATSINAGAPLSITAGMASATDGLDVGSAQTLAAPAGGSQGSLMLVSAYGGTGSSTSPCTIMQVSAITAQPYGAQILHDAGTGQWNPPSSTTFSSPQLYGAGASVMDIGSFHWVTYRINNTTSMLEQADRFAAASVPASPIAEDVVYMRAQYGIANPGGVGVANWVDASGAWAWPAAAANFGQVRAIRIGLVVRIPAAVKPSGGPGAACDATTTPPELFPATTSPIGARVVADLSATPNASCYKYRTLSLVVPLKNIVFGES